MTTQAQGQKPVSQGQNPPQNNIPAKPVETASERFTKMVLKEFAGSVGEIALTNFQKRLCQSYFMTIDYNLKIAEEKRLKKDEKYRDSLPITWQNVDMVLLARKVVGCSRMGLDPAMKNHINIIPFKDNATNKYQMTFIEGYRGLEIIASKYGLANPDSVTIEVVYSTDKFVPIKKTAGTASDTYMFEITKPFDRGEIVGGFYYLEYVSNPSKNKLMFYNLAEIEKRKPEYASAEFWGGEKPKWEKDENGKSKKTGTEKVEGWLPEMVYKTLARAAYNSITIDSQKVDDNYLVHIENEQEASRGKNSDSVNDEVAKKGNKESIDFDDAQVVTEKLEQSSKPQDAAPVKPIEKPSEPAQQTLQPGF